MKTQKLTILAPESELPAEGADVPVLDESQEPAASDLLNAYSDLLAESAITFTVSADGDVELGETSDSESLLELAVAGEAGSEATVRLSSETPKAQLDLASAASSVSGAFDADDGVRKLVTNLAAGLRDSLGADAGAPIPLMRWHKTLAEGEGNAEQTAGGVAQLLGVWLADEEQLEALSSGGGEGIIFEDAEVEGRGLRTTLTGLAVMGVMLGGSVSAEAGLFFRKASKAKPDQTQTVQQSRQAPAEIDRRALTNTGSDDTMVVIDVSKQRAYLMANGKVIVDTPCSTARAGKHTPRGEFQITQRVRSGKTSTIYGCALPYWMRLDQSAIGLHVGELPGYPASAGCVRLPSNIAPLLYDFTESGTTVKIVDSWQPAGSMVAMR